MGGGGMGIGGGGNSGQLPPDGQAQFLRGAFNNVTPEMLNYGFSAGQDMINKQRDKWMPGVSGFWNSLKIYFAV